MPIAPAFGSAGHVFSLQAMLVMVRPCLDCCSSTHAPLLLHLSCTTLRSADNHPPSGPRYEVRIFCGQGPVNSCWLNGPSKVEVNPSSSEARVLGSICLTPTLRLTPGCLHSTSPAQRPSSDGCLPCPVVSFPFLSCPLPNRY